mmetsp:Transcript_55549/g.102783  ORF Transcript_55549/g.102783 Transcript_55549/m.102783 type:complete len:84 (+) Transcript_55549:1210-1461(+)
MKQKPPSGRLKKSLQVALHSLHALVQASHSHVSMYFPHAEQNFPGKVQTSLQQLKIWIIGWPLGFLRGTSRSQCPLLLTSLNA